uniref:acyltransferase n=1 Tax=uncultured Sphingomonas sp. TaxID=158754 RepID=UPI0035CBD425
MFLTASHVIGGAESRAGADVAKPITIENGCWIGANATVLPGVQIAQGCVIAAGSIVTRDTDPHGIYGGVPASRIKDLLRQAAS